jgi:hypothetical protein
MSGIAQLRWAIVDGFSADKWEKLSDAERIEHCRVAAREAETYAQLARPELQAVYKDHAASWHLLAAEIEASRRVRR